MEAMTDKGVDRQSMTLDTSGEHVSSPVSEIAVNVPVAGVNEDADNDDSISDYTVKDAMLLFTPADLVHSLWKPCFTISRNLRLILSAVCRFIAVHRDDEVVGACKMSDAVSLKQLIKDIYKNWVAAESARDWIVDPTKSGRSLCLANEMCGVLKKCVPIASRRLFFNDGMFSEDCFRDWINYVKEYCGERIALRSSDFRNKERVAAVERDEDDDESVVIGANSSWKSKRASGEVGVSTSFVRSGQAQKRGLDAAFDDELSFLSSDATRVSQYITKLRNGRVLTMKTPGESGDELIRVQIYDTKDILKREPRTWWKYAKFRVQCLCTSLFDDQKRRSLREFMDHVADDIKVIEGVDKDARRMYYDLE